MPPDETTVTATLVDTSPALAVWHPPSDLSEAQIQLVETYKAIQSGPLTVSQPNAYVSDYETVQAFALAGALAPPEDPRQVANVYRRSSALRPCVEAVATNSCGFGFDFEPVIDLAHADADKRIREAIIQDRLAQGNEQEPTDQDVSATRQEIERGMLREKFKLARFFDHVCPTRSFTKLRWESRVEVGGGGNAYWEVVRDAKTKALATFDRVEAHAMRLRRADEKYLLVEVNQRRSPLGYDRVQVARRFRTYVQLVMGGARTVYFKEFGDPRVVSSVTGRFYPTLDLLKYSEPSSAPATEIIHWRAFDAIGPYGLPPWYGAQYAVMGNLASERVNYDYFDNKAIPPFAIFVSGGKLATGATDKLKELMQSIKGQGAFWKILVLEADSAGGPNAKCKIELHPLLTAMPEDAMFQQYEANNAKKIQQQWRLPDLLVGRSQEANRAQAEAALQMAEQQVMEPIRQEEDDFFNRFVLSEMGIRFWKFRTNSAVAKDPQLQTDIGVAWVKAGVLTPNEGRGIASEVLNDPTIQPIDEPWASIPQPLMLAGIVPGVKDGVVGKVGPDEETLARRMIALRDQLASNAESGAAVAEVGARAREATQSVKVRAEEWKSLWEA